MDVTDRYAGKKPIAVNTRVIRAGFFIALAMAQASLAVGQAAEQKPALEFRTKVAKGSVTIDAALAVYPALRASLLADGKRELARCRRDAEKEARRDPEARPWECEREYVLSSVAGGYVSVVYYDWWDAGGTHPGRDENTILWDRDANRRVNVRPLFKETTDDGPTMQWLARRARLEVARLKDERERADDQEFGGPAAAEQKARPLTDEAAQRLVDEDWFINGGIQPQLLKLGPISLAPSTIAGKSSGLTLHYPPYAVGGYVEGSFTVFIPWADFKTLLTDKGIAIFGGEKE